MRNEAYWDGTPGFDRVTVLSITDGDTLTMALQSGEIDAAYGLPYTSYPLFQNALNRYFENRVQIIDSATACADYVSDFIQKNDLCATPGKGAKNSFFVTDLHSEFAVHAARFLSHPPERVQKIVLTED